MIETKAFELYEITCDVPGCKMHRTSAMSLSSGGGGGNSVGGGGSFGGGGGDT